MMFLVMNMKYIIYEYATGMEKLFEQYPHLNDVIYSALSKRQEYHRIGHLHIFENQLTHEIIHLEVKKYAIEVESRDKNNIFFDILYHNLKSYVIINGNL